MDREGRAPGAKLTRAVVLSALSLVGVPCFGQVELDLLPVVLEDGAEVEFTQSYSEPVAETPDGWREWPCAESERYKVCVDLDQIRPGRYGMGFSYVLFVLPKGPRGAEEMVRFRFLAKPVGRFRDQEQPVDFKIAVDSRFETGQLRLPLHSRSSEPFLRARLPELPVKVRMGDSEVIPIDLVNELENLSVVVSEDLLVGSQKSHMWESPPVAELVPFPGEEEGKLRLRPGYVGRGRIQLKLQAVRGEALLASANPYRRGREAGGVDQLSGVHDRITAYIPYRTRGGLWQELAVEVPIRFWPSVWVLASIVVGGALVGSLLLLLLRGRDLRSWLWEAGAALIMGLLAWLVALVLVSLDSEVRILGLELDPYQIVPAFLIGVLVALGGGKAAPLLKRVPGLSQISGDNERKEAESEGSRREH